MAKSKTTAARPERSEHDQGYNLGLQRAMTIVQEARGAAADRCNTRAEKEASFHVTEIALIAIDKEILK